MAIATIGINNHMGMMIDDIEYGVNDRIVYHYEGVWGTETTRKYRARVYSTVKGRDYINARHGRVYLDECIRTC